MTSHAYFDWIDEQPRTPTGVLVRTSLRETRTVPYHVVAKAYEFRARSMAARRPRAEAVRRTVDAIGRRLEQEEHTA